MAKQTQNPTTQVKHESYDAALKREAVEEQEDREAAKAKAAKAAKKQAKRAKRAKKLYELLKEKGASAVNNRITYREWKDGLSTTVNGQVITFLQGASSISGQDTSWKHYCTWKADAAREYWLKQAEKPSMTEKTLARKKAKLQKAREQMARLEAELAELGIQEADAK